MLESNMLIGATKIKFWLI